MLALRKIKLSPPHKIYIITTHIHSIANKQYVVNTMQIMPIPPRKDRPLTNTIIS